ncbi:hypothetical protein BDA96_03G307500 [Sorghum bicolor]|uniref:Uncharacterized protein n=2 Tax=Sorghum bicolor TaxID=4558 RepID=A0A921UQ70_SORBI|nr:uncharacterized protein LOC8062124 [Sorghum bicolor]KAG0539260.1 hypothetical protein BDA96_03G307500 [Sorghum bicolor]KXG33305.1 hypothetical protein SORBI_3003G284900 [Sorghum bicolor]|eukprot:XP_002458440.2 uncharacterized protein LOC8062124 [Sorghum bicolor]
MEGDAVLSSMDSLWFYSSVFLRPSSNSKHKESECAEEPQQDSASETNKTTSGGRPCQPPKCVKEAAAQTGRRAEGGTVRIADARGCSWEWDERMVAWQKEQRRRARVAAAARARCSQTMMPPPGEGVAMKAHLRSWAHAVACSVR